MLTVTQTEWGASERVNEYIGNEEQTDRMKWQASRNRREKAKSWEMKKERRIREEKAHENYHEL